MRYRRHFLAGLPFGLAVAALSTLAAHAHARQEEAGQGNARQRLLAQANELASSVKSFVDAHLGDRPPAPAMRGLFVYAPDAADNASRWKPHDAPAAPRAILLVHGLDDLGDIWDDLAPAISADPALGNGVDIVRFEYANDQAVARSADELHAALKDLRARGVVSVDLVCHSMGGLVARDALTRPSMYAGRANGHADLPDATRLIMLGTPNAGSPFAKFRWLCEAREQIVRWARSDSKNVRDLGRFDGDGCGEAAEDLMPGSAYLAELNGRAMPPAPLRVINVVGTLTTAENLRLDRALSLPVVTTVLGEKKAAELLQSGRALTHELGDGVVSVKSATMEGAQTTYVKATHRGMIRHFDVAQAARKLAGNDGPPPTPPAVPIVLDCLREEPAPAR